MLAIYTGSCIILAGSVTSKYGSQCSKALPTTIYFSTAASHRNGDKGAFTVYTVTLTKSLASCKDSVDVTTATHNRKPQCTNCYLISSPDLS